MEPTNHDRDPRPRDRWGRFLPYDPEEIDPGTEDEDDDQHDDDLDSDDDAEQDGRLHDEDAHLTS